jgi:NAD(P)-dependent dehydrogenase (short-subunit alcohol dehydrogenase family)
MANMKTPMGRAAEPEEVIDFILYLCSEKAAFITGSNHLIDGGYCC